MLTQIFAATASLALIGSGIVASSETRSAAAIPNAIAADQGGSGGKCVVDVLRTASPNTAKVTREDLPDGTCRCEVIAGPAGNNGDAESLVQSVISDRTCQSSPAPAGTEQANFVPGGGGGAILPVVLGVVGLTGIVTAVGNDTNG